jgi:hypothetical protein
MHATAKTSGLGIICDNICCLIQESYALGIDPPFNSNRNYEVFWGEN